MDKRQIIIIIAIIFFTGLTIYKIASPEIATPIINKVPVVEKQTPEIKPEDRVVGKAKGNIVYVPFEHFSEETLQKADITIIPSNGFKIVNSILSNQEYKIVYSEMKLADKSFNSLLDFEYNVIVKDLNTEEKINIFSGPIMGANIRVYLPIAWTPNDKKIILEQINAFPVGGGGVPEYGTFTVNPNTGEVKGLTEWIRRGFFTEDYKNVITTKTSDNSHTVDHQGPAGIVNSGSIIIQNIETSEEKILLAEDNSYYTIKSLDNNILTYTHRQTIDNPDNEPYGKFNDSVPEEKIINIANKQSENFITNYLPADWIIEYNNTFYSPEMYNMRHGGPYSLLIKINNEFNSINTYLESKNNCIENKIEFKLNDNKAVEFKDSCSYANPQRIIIKIDDSLIITTSYSISDESDEIKKILSSLELTK